MKEAFGRQIPTGTKFADLHFHTSTSFDVHHGMSAKEAVMLAQNNGLDAIAITDHDLISTAYDALNFAARMKLTTQVVVGEEVTTKDGHLVGLFLEDKIAPGMSVESTIYEIHKQGGLAIAAHPFASFPLSGDSQKSLKQDAIGRVIDCQDPAVYFDGFEVYSMGMQDFYARKRQRNFKTTDPHVAPQIFYVNNRESLGAPIASSDGHRLSVGRAAVGYSGDLKSAIESASTLAVYLSRAEQWEAALKSLHFFGHARAQKEISFDALRKMALGY